MTDLHLKNIDPVELCFRSPEVLEFLARHSGYPTEGPLAEAIWRHSNREHGMSLRDAKYWMEHMGYKPFVGYPLQRK